MQHLLSSGAQSIACIGICWGGWTLAQITSDSEMAPHFVCAASPHPSITLEEGVYSGNTLSLMQSMRCPTLLMPANGDPDEYRAGLLPFLIGACPNHGHLTV
jgi:dienelactone hydrolase